MLQGYETRLSLIANEKPRVVTVDSAVHFGVSALAVTARSMSVVEISGVCVKQISGTRRKRSGRKCGAC